MPTYTHHYQDLAAEGPNLPITVSPSVPVINFLQAHNLPIPQPVSGRALVDTGASLCLVDEAVIQSFGSPPFGVETIDTPTGRSETDRYSVSLSFPGTPPPTIDFAVCISAPLRAGGIIAIIGRNVLRNFVLVYNGPGGWVSLAY